MAKFGVGIGKDDTLSDDEVSRRFAARHRLGLWMALLPFVAFFGTAFISLEGRVWPVFVGAGCIAAALAYVGFLYRCPRCGTVPSSSVAGTTGILLFPKKCPKCDVPLLPRHRWAQD
jgi:hypothetical protein